MKKNNDSRKFLISAVIWTVVSLVVLALFILTGKPNLTGILGGVALVGFCVAGQWLRYFKFR